MDCCLSYTKPRFPTPPAAALRQPVNFGLRAGRRLPVVNASSASRCEFGGLNAPLEPRTPVGKLLRGVLLDDRAGFHASARKELERLAFEREAAAARLQLSLGSDEACLHSYWRISEFRCHESQDAVEEVMYMHIFYKFSEMGVNLVPRLSKCAYKGRLEIWPSKDWELESIHSPEVLQLVRDHLNAVIGCRANSNVKDSWATTNIQRLRLCELYAASILYGYFLKTVSFRFQLEQALDPSTSHFGVVARGQHPVSEMFSAGSDYIAYGHVSSPRSAPTSPMPYSPMKKPTSLRFYMMGFDQEAIQKCARPKSKEAEKLVERHSCALFGDGETDLLETDDVITTSFASLKRFLLEAVAFGCFLWDAENSVGDVYMLEDN